jgi:hypothetical protein
VILGLARCRGFQRLLHRPTGGVVDMDDPAMAVPTLPGQVPVLTKFVGRPTQVEWHAQLCQPVDRLRGMFDDKFDCRAVVEPRARDHRIFDMAFKGVAGFEHRRNPALRPRRRAIRQRALGQHRHLVFLRQLQRRCQPCRARSDDEDVGFHAFTPRFRW